MAQQVPQEMAPTLLLELGETREEPAYDLHLWLLAECVEYSDLLLWGKEGHVEGSHVLLQGLVEEVAGDGLCPYAMMELRNLVHQS